MTESTVTLGELSFDPLGASDFRATVEGKSKVGKSNTLAVICEDLADVAVPTIIIERVGTLTTLRSEMEDLVVVGAPGADGVDIPVALDDLGTVGDYVVEDGWKVLVDVSTYSDYEADESLQHKAAATALSAVYSQSKDRYRSGTRRKVLAIIDEAHVLAPEQGSSHVDTGDYVKQARAQVIRYSTEGGNIGISTVLAFQRRGLIQNSTLTQVDNYILHRLDGADAERAASDTMAGKDTIENLGVGEIVAYGDFTGGDVVGPTTVRKRHSPDPREETFELPDRTGDVAEAIEQMREEAEERREEREQREDELEQLRERVETLETENADLREQLRTADVLEKLADSGGSVDDATAERVRALEDENERLRDEVDRLEVEVDAAERAAVLLREEKESLESRLIELEAQHPDEDELRDVLLTLADALGVEVDAFATVLGGAPDPRDSDVEERVRALEDENERLRERLAESDGFEPIEEVSEFLKDETVRDAVSTAVEENGRVTEEKVKAVFAAIQQRGEPVDYADIASVLGHTDDSEASRAVRALRDVYGPESPGVIRTEREGGKNVVYLNRDGINELRREAKRREQAQDLMENMEV